MGPVRGAGDQKREVFLEAEKEANPLFPLNTAKEEEKVLHMMQPDIHAATVSGLDDVIDWSSSDEEDQVISIDLPPGYQPKVSRPKGQAAKVAAVDPNDVGEDGQIKLFLTTKPRSQDDGGPRCCDPVKAKTMPKQAASASDQATASAAGSSSTQPGEIRGPGISPKAAAPKARGSGPRRSRTTAVGPS